MGFYNVINPLSMQAGQPEDISQVLANLNAIAGVLNGSIDNSNVAVAAAIARSKLDFGAGLTNADIATGAAIDGAKLADGSVTNAKISAVGGITGDKIATGAIGSTQLTDGGVAFVDLGHLYSFYASTTYGFPADTATRIITGTWTVYFNPSSAFVPGGNCYVAPANGFYCLWSNWCANFGSDSYTMSLFNYNNAAWLGATCGYLRSTGDSLEGLTNLTMIRLNANDQVFVGGWSSVGGTVEVRYGGFRIPV